jgi:hypothetical protein
MVTISNAFTKVAVLSVAGDWRDKKIVVNMIIATSW